nr:adhesion G-protein coupled receptor G2-like [Ciona intestinalis]|eukprot:XP_026692270.1 adhesion G-protein coupled receptor G2-like [Ciona intestinalis]
MKNEDQRFGHCNKEKVGNLTFPTTAITHVALSEEKCNTTGLSRGSAICKHNEQVEAYFDKSSIFYVPCQFSINSLVEQVISLGENITDESIVNGVNQLEVIASGPDLISGDTKEKFVEFFKTISDLAAEGKAKITSNTLITVLSISAKISKPHASGHLSTPEENKEKQDIVKSISTLAENVILSKNEVLEVENDLFTVKIFDHEGSSSVSYSPVVKGVNGNNSQPAKISIPNEALVQTLSKGLARKKRSTENATFRLSLAMYNDASLFPTNDNVSNVISAGVGVNARIKDLAEPVEVLYLNIGAKHGESITATIKTKTSVVCKYWDFTTSKWADDGCCLNETANPTQCLCNHLTNFALLVTSVQGPTDVVLSVISDVGCILSIIGLFVTILVHALHRESMKKRPAKILLNICSNLLIAYFIFVVGVSQTSNRTGCKVVAVLLHYFFLTTWCWMSVYSYDMYMSLVKVFRGSESKLLQRMAAFAYITPAAIVIITAGVAMGYVDQKQKSTLCGKVIDPTLSSSYIADHMCWLTGGSLYFGFLLPVAAMLMYNFFVFISIFRELNKNSSKVTTEHMRRTTKQTMTIAVTMTSLMGVTWVFGYLLVISTDVIYVTVFSWLFALSNTLQGFLIFLLTAVRRKNLRNVWTAPFKRLYSSTSSAAVSSMRKVSGRTASYSVSELTKYPNGEGDTAQTTTNV